MLYTDENSDGAKNMSEMKVSGEAKKPAPRKKTAAGSNSKATGSAAKKTSGTRSASGASKPRKKSAPKVAEKRTVEGRIDPAVAEALKALRDSL